MNLEQLEQLKQQAEEKYNDIVEIDGILTVGTARNLIRDFCENQFSEWSKYFTLYNKYLDLGTVEFLNHESTENYKINLVDLISINKFLDHKIDRMIKFNDNNFELYTNFMDQNYPNYRQKVEILKKKYS